MVYSGIQKPNGKIVAAGEPLVQELKVETATNMYPGRLVKKGTSDDLVVVNTVAGACLGWIGYEQANPEYKPADVDTIYAKDDIVPVLFGGKFVIVGTLAAGQNVAKGARLVAAASGELTAATAATVTTGTASATAVDDTTPTVAGSVGSDGIIVAIAEESVDASSAAADILVRSLI